VSVFVRERRIFSEKICVKRLFGLNYLMYAKLVRDLFICKMSVIAKCVVTACNKMAYIYKKKLACTLISRSSPAGT
jgi:hypothetical protein